MFLNQPITEKSTVVIRNEYLYVACSTMQGWRSKMEDAYTILVESPMDQSCTYCALFDGHHGSSVAKFAQRFLHQEIFLQKHYHAGNVRRAIKKGYLSLDKLLMEDPKVIEEGAGSTALVLLIKNGIIHCGNVGDSRAIAFVNGMPKDLSFDHTPDLPDEHNRIEKAGLRVIHNRVEGSLGMSRSLGDFKYKKNNSLPPVMQAVTAFPEVNSYLITQTWEFIAMATDGIFNVMSTKELATLIHTKIIQGVRPECITEQVLDCCLSPNLRGMGTDNMSLILIILTKNVEEKYAKNLENLTESNSCPSSQTSTSGSDCGPSTSGTQGPVL